MRWCDLVRDVMYECGILVPVIRAMRRRDMAWRDVMRFMTLRLLASRAYGETTIIEVPERVPVYCRYDLLAYRELFLLDDYGTTVWRAPFAAEKEPLVLDIGANVGMFAALCQSINPCVRLRCFEMMPACAPIIRRRLAALGQQDLEVITSVVGSGRRETMAVRFDSPYAPGNAVNRAWGRENVSVPSISLDAWWKASRPIGAPFLVKIDVEGAEGEVWEGGHICISSASLVLVELHGSPLEAVFKGFEKTHQVLFTAKKTGDMAVVALRKKR